MDRLRPGWFLEGLWDAEYQQYRLLAYLNQVQRAFLAQQLYPPLGDLIASYTELLRIKQEVSSSSEAASPELDTLEEIISFALPRLHSHIEEGRTLYETIAQHLQVEVVGVVPLYRDEGYVFSRRGAEPEVRVYSYELRHLYDAEGQQVAIRLAYFRSYSYSALALGFKRIREQVLAEKPDLPVPFTLAVESPWAVPVEATLLPIIQRALPKWTQEAAPSPPN